jgi:1-acyl-sn-glycerol-3-phosphate acyltransferase
MPGNFGITAYAIWKTLAISIPTVADALLGRLDPAVSDARLQRWAQSLIARADVSVDVHGRELVPDRACILMSNHQSLFDIPICYRIYPHRLRMVAKQELFRVPIWGRAMRESGFVAVDRSGDRAQATAAMQQAAEAIAAGTTIWIAPEGTRSPDGRLGKLKKGGFRLAVDTGTPILPLALDGSIHIIPKKTKLVRRGVRVRATFGAPISVAGRQVADLIEELRAFLTAHITPPEAAL